MSNNIKKIILILIIVIFVVFNCNASAYAYPIMNEPTSDISQSQQFLKDRNASKKMLNSLEYIYSYSKKVGVDPTLIVAMSSIETGYGKSNLFVNYNNPTGMKAKNGWAKYNTIKDGYKAMIDHYALYAGYPQTIHDKKSWLNGVAKNTENMKGIWWGNYGIEANYHKYLSIQVEGIKKYPVKKTTNEIKIFENNYDNNLLLDAINNEEENTGGNKIMEILNRNKHDNSKGMNILLNAIK